ncbi:MAG: isoprenylcysteine carboxylmethyltransferase family protein [Bacteroidetes bacterium]|nr:isoprenylcysteine carboxylmethyltransferase family protein [Bacteroidota bacterium]
MSKSAPSIHVPPPLILLAGFLAGYGVDALIPLPLVPQAESTALLVVQWGLLGLGAAFSLWGFLTFVRARTGVLPNQSVTQFVTHGPYRFSRNPMYTGLTLMYLGFTRWINSVWPLLMLPLALWVLWKLVIQKEEAFLTKTYGDAYTSYQKRVRRWI